MFDRALPGPGDSGSSTAYDRLFAVFPTPFGLSKFTARGWRTSPEKSGAKKRTFK